MSEYEIFNDDEEYTPEPPRNKEKNNEGCCKKFFKDLFTMEYISLFLTVLSIFFSFLVGMIPLFNASPSAFAAVAVFFLFSFCLALGGLVVEVVKVVKNKQFNFNLQIILVIASLLIACLVLPLTANIGAYY